MVRLGPLLEPAAGTCEDGLAFGKSLVGRSIPTPSPSLSISLSLPPSLPFPFPNTQSPQGHNLYKVSCGVRHEAGGPSQLDVDARTASAEHSARLHGRPTP
jgi:hypothetical protein